MSEDILQQLVKMVGTNHRHQLEIKKKMDRQLDKTVSRLDRLEVQVDMLQHENS